MVGRGGVASEEHGRRSICKATVMSTDIVDNLPGAVAEPIARHSESIVIDAAPQRVWDLVTAMDRYGEWSNENAGGYWRKGADGVPGTGKVGDQFVGINRRDGNEWKAPVEIVCRDEPRDFAFVTGGLAMNLVLWRYQLEPQGDGTLLTESWTLRQITPTIAEKGDAELAYRRNNAVTSIQATLAGIKAAAEAG